MDSIRKISYEDFLDFKRLFNRKAEKFMSLLYGQIQSIMNFKKRPRPCQARKGLKGAHGRILTLSLLFRDILVVMTDFTKFCECEAYCDEETETIRFAIGHGRNGSP